MSKVENVWGMYVAKWRHMLLNNIPSLDKNEAKFLANLKKELKRKRLWAKFLRGEI